MAKTQYARYENECGYGYNPYKAAQDDADRARLDAMLATIDAEWTAEVTAERRAAWNAAVAASTDKTHAAQLRIEAELGFTKSALIAAVQTHK